jgi:hypothetical protein
MYNNIYYIIMICSWFNTKQRSLFRSWWEMLYIVIANTFIIYLISLLVYDHNKKKYKEMKIEVLQKNKHHDSYYAFLRGLDIAYLTNYALLGLSG